MWHRVANKNMHSGANLTTELAARYHSMMGQVLSAVLTHVVLDDSIARHLKCPPDDSIEWMSCSKTRLPVSTQVY